MFMVLLSWHGHCKRLPSSFDECKVELSAMWPLANLGYHSYQCAAAIHIHLCHFLLFIHWAAGRASGL